MDLNGSDLDFLRRLQKSAEAPVWPGIGAFLAGAFGATFHLRDFGAIGLITIEALFVALIFLAVVGKRRERRIVSIMRKIIGESIEQKEG